MKKKEENSPSEASRIRERNDEFIKWSSGFYKSERSEEMAEVVYSLVRMLDLYRTEKMNSMRFYVDLYEILKSYIAKKTADGTIGDDEREFSQSILDLIKSTSNESLGNTKEVDLQDLIPKIKTIISQIEK